MLDTKATKDCISETLALELGLIIERSHEGVILTATLDQKLFHVGTAKLSFTWTDKGGTPQRVKRELYVVPGISIPMILSHDFTTRHPEVWSVSNLTEELFERINVLGFRKIRKKDQEIESAFLQQQSQANRDTDHLIVEREQVELESRLGGSIEHPTSEASTAASVAASQTNTTGPSSPSQPHT